MTTTINQYRLINILAKVGIIVLLYFALQPMPYGYYTFLRLFCTGAFVVIAMYEYKRINYILIFIAVIGIIIFNPVFKIYLHKDQWNVIDIVVGVIVAVWLCFDVFRWIKNRKVE